jgi:hypothetical protein
MVSAMLPRELKPFDFFVLPEPIFLIIIEKTVVRLSPRKAIDLRSVFTFFDAKAACLVFDI